MRLGVGFSCTPGADLQAVGAFAFFSVDSKGVASCCLMSRLVEGLGGGVAV